MFMILVPLLLKVLMILFQAAAQRARKVPLDLLGSKFYELN